MVDTELTANVVKIKRYEMAEGKRGQYLKFEGTDVNGETVFRSIFNPDTAKIIKANVGKSVTLFEYLNGDYWNVDSVEVSSSQAVEKATEQAVSKNDSIEAQVAAKTIGLAYAAGRFPQEHPAVQAWLKWATSKLAPSLVDEALKLGATPLTKSELFKEACEKAQLNPDTRAGQTAIKKWLVKMFPSYTKWSDLNDEAQDKAIAEMRKAAGPVDHAEEQQDLPF